MEFVLADLHALERYRLLVTTITPRPIALVTSVDAGGQINAAPFSYFNVLGSDPPVMALGVGYRRDGSPKDTAANIQATGEFVIHLVTEDIAAPMNLCGTDFPPGTNEANAAGFTLVPSRLLRVPRILEAPAAFECRLIELKTIGLNHIILGEAVAAYVADEYLRPDGSVDGTLLALVGRLGGSEYARTTDRFALERISFAEWHGRKGDTEQ